MYSRQDNWPPCGHKMTEAYTLRHELRNLIKQFALHWQHKRTSKPTVAELVVMACGLSDEPLSIPEAVGWMCRHSHHFPDLIDNMVPEDSTRMTSDPFRNPVQWQDEVGIALVDFKIPIHELDELGSKRWTCSISSANIFLRRRVFPYNKGRNSQAHFRIMDLPVEVREMIFEFVLMLPRSGVWFDFQAHYKICGKRTITLDAWTVDRDLVPSQYWPDTWHTDKDSFRGPPKSLFRVDLKSHLALLRVSKLVHKEAFPCFYSRNVFCLPNDWAFQELFKNLSDSQFRLLEHVVWRWTSSEIPARSHVQQLAALPRLRTLVIDTESGEDFQTHIISAS